MIREKQCAIDIHITEHWMFSLLILRSIIMIDRRTKRLIAVDRLRVGAMVSFVVRLSVLVGAGTITALVVILLTSGLVDIGVAEPWESGVIPGLVLLGTAILVALWYETT